MCGTDLGHGTTRRLVAVTKDAARVAQGLGFRGHILNASIAKCPVLPWHLLWPHRYWHCTHRVSAHAPATRCPVLTSRALCGTAQEAANDFDKRVERAGTGPYPPTRSLRHVGTGVEACYALSGTGIHCVWK
eukprot:1321590-Rhodomonas_salina.2